MDPTKPENLQGYVKAIELLEEVRNEDGVNALICELGLIMYQFVKLQREQEEHNL